MGLTTYDESFPFLGVNVLNNASGTTPVAVVNAQPQKVRLDKMRATSTCAAPYVLGIFLRTSGVSYRIGGISIPAGAGDGTVPTVDVLAGMLTPIDGLTLSNAWGIYAGVDTTITAPGTITLSTYGGFI
jgi:hypothetical protein